MAHRATEDVALLQPSITVGDSNTIAGVLKILKDCTPEIKNLLENECNCIYECRVCNNLFRSVSNLLSHKRVYCRTRYETIVQMNANSAMELAEHAVEERKNDQKKIKGVLKRTNIVTALNKRKEHYALKLANSEHTIDLHAVPRIFKPAPTTFFENGQQIFETMPHALAMKEAVPSDRVILVIPQDNSSRYREMTLRHRKGDNTKMAISRDVGPEEIDIIVRFERYLITFVDVSSLTCSHSDCKDKLPFSSLFALAFHVTVKHNKRTGAERLIPCFLCDLRLQTYSLLTTHLKDVHERVRADHVASRCIVADEKESKRGRKPKQSKQLTAQALIDRGRSLSPLSDDFMESDGSVVVSDDNDAAPILEPVKTIMDEKSQKQADLATNAECSSAMENLTVEKVVENTAVKTVGEHYFLQALSHAKVDSGSVVIDVLESEWAVNNRVAYMVAYISEEYDKAIELHDEEYNSEKSASPKNNNPCKVVQKGGPSTKQCVGKRDTKKVTDTKSVKDQRSRSEKKKANVTKVKPTERPSKHKSTERGPNDEKTRVIKRKSNFLKPSVSIEQKANDTDEDGEVREQGADKQKKRPGRKCNRVKASKEREDKELSETNERTVSSLSCDPIHADALNAKDKDYLSGNSDEMDDMPKLRPSRQRRKPNWINDNFVTGFNRKRPKTAENEMDTEDDPECDEVPRKRRSPSQSNESKYKCEEDFVSYSVVWSESRMAVKQETDHENANTAMHSDPGPSSFVLPPPKELIDANNEKTTRKVPDIRAQYTPRARKIKFGEDKIDLGAKNEVGAPSTSTAVQSRRKQNLSRIAETDDVTIVRYSNGKAPPRPQDLSEIPVYLTELQRDLFFSFIRPASPSTDGAHCRHKCMQCGSIVNNLMEGRRHAVSHLRIMRLRCSLCNSGSFFCSDMRTHLQYRHCENLKLAPRGYVLPGDFKPCMTQKQADELTKLVDPAKPGRVMFTSGKIISAASPKPYYPDSAIEERVLGARKPLLFDERSSGSESLYHESHSFNENFDDRPDH